MAGSAKDSQLKVLVCHSSFLPSFLHFKIDIPGSVAWSHQEKGQLPGLGEEMSETLQGPVSPELCL